MKIATLTFHRALNYGAVLQTYALQKVLDDLGYDTEVLDYRSSLLKNIMNQIRYEIIYLQKKWQFFYYSMDFQLLREVSFSIFWTIRLD